MPVFERSVELSTSVERAFAWHERPGALQRLTPPWEPVEVVHTEGGIANGGKATLRLRVGPVPLQWNAEHLGYDPPHRFEDRQVGGPFSSWHHVHSFAEHAGNRCLLTDRIEFELPLAGVGNFLGRGFVENKLDAMFTYRHRVTCDDLRFHQSLPSEPKRIAITGASGLVGESLVAMLSTGGHTPIRLTRSEPVEENERYWSPTDRVLDAESIADCDAVIHLAGESVMGHWTDEKRKRIRESRVVSTDLIARTMASLESGPKTLIVASAMGYYGDRGDEVLHEHSGPGDGFLPEVCEEWEAAANPARDAGIRVAHIRLGMVLSSGGAALANMKLPFRLGVGGKVASGRQYWSWIAIDDAAALFAWSALNENAEGPMNGVAPEPLTNREFTKVLGSVLRRPTVIPIPGVALRKIFGEVADDLLLASARVIPERTCELGYRFRFTDLEDALRHELGRA